MDRNVQAAGQNVFVHLLVCDAPDQPSSARSTVINDLICASLVPTQPQKMFAVPTMYREHFVPTTWISPQPFPNGGSLGSVTIYDWLQALAFSNSAFNAAT
jgi:hypothetical protein